ncbi:glycerophosphodiester phosphodiesterase family protein [Nitrogeniibacter aestuarii]|uniref:glycerophosphodiester phosphodiesterase family protein n=1 Tax=Nitrogeniibacter aestuarii TaxID=2815343 RepID=UPI001D10E3CE|nr:glycerophosphodiester phosphodiesterase family protein [Nitrogeniibacter aestuarii]
MKLPWRWSPVVAHRCGGRLAPENSLEGLARAAAAGLHCVEFDVMLAQCGTPVVIHDETLERTTCGEGRVADTAWSALKSLRLRDVHGTPTDSRLPSLVQVLDACALHGLAANLEIKPSTGCAVQTGRAVAERLKTWLNDASLAVLLTSFERQALDAAMAVAPDLDYGHLFDGEAAAALAAGDLAGCSHLVFNDAHVDESSIKTAMTRGYGVAVYTVNDAARARDLWSWGVAGVISDVPDGLATACYDTSLA